MNQYGNIGNTECIVRYVFGGIVIVGILYSLLPPVMALLAAYVIFTAMLAREPLYDLFSYARQHPHHAPRSARPLAHAGGTKHKAIHGV